MQPTGTLGEQIFITGEGLYLISNVVFGGDASGSFTESQDGIRATVPQNAAWGLVKIESQARGITGYSNLPFVPQPEITGFQPISGLPGDIVSLRGYAFSGVTGITVNNLPVQFWLYRSNFSVDIEIPSGNTKGYITLFGQSGLYSRSPFEFSPSALVTGLSRLSGYVGDSLEILGTNFLPEILHPVNVAANEYLVGIGQITGRFIRINNEKLTGVIPANALSDKVYVFKTINEVFPSISSLHVIPNRPVITKLTPSSGATLARIAVDGSGFLNVTSISITGNGNGINIPITTGTPTTLTSLGNALFFTIPTGATEGLYSLVIRASGGIVTGSGALYVLDHPTVSGFTPTVGKGGDVITISGRNLYPFSRVCFNSLNDPDLVILSGYGNNSFIDVMVPYQGFEVNEVVVDNTVGSGITGTFTFVSQPVIQSFNPQTGSWGTIVTVSGTGLQFIKTVSFNDYQVNHTSLGATGFSFVIPTGSNDSVIKVVTSGDTVYSSGRFDVIPPLIILSGFLPTSGLQRDTITLTGAYFSTATGLAFSGVSGQAIFAPFLSNVSGVITTTIPVGARNGKISLFNQSGRSQSSTDFVVLIPPVITGYSPVSGIFQTTVTIVGTDFAANDTKFFFKGVTGNWIEGSGTTILGSTIATTKVPREIITGPIMASGRNEISNEFLRFFALPSITGVNPRRVFSSDDSFIVISGINAYEADPRYLMITGSGKLRNLMDHSGRFVPNYSQVINGSNGFTIITGYINAEFIGSGRLALVSIYHSGITGGNIITDDIFTTSGAPGNQPYFFISGSQATVSGYTPATGGNRLIFQITGNNFYEASTLEAWYPNDVTMTVINWSVVNSRLITGRIEPSGLNVTTSTGIRFAVYTPYNFPLASFGPRTYTHLENIEIGSITPTQTLTGRHVRILGAGFTYAHGSGWLVDPYGNATPIPFTGYDDTIASGYIPVDITLSDQDLKLRLANLTSSGEKLIYVLNQRDIDTLEGLEITALMFS